MQEAAEAACEVGLVTQHGLLTAGAGDLITVLGKALVQENVVEPHDDWFKDGCNRKGPRPRDGRIVLRVGDLVQMLGGPRMPVWPWLALLRPPWRRPVRV